MGYDGAAITDGLEALEATGFDTIDGDGLETSFEKNWCDCHPYAPTREPKILQRLSVGVARDDYVDFQGHMLTTFRVHRPWMFCMTVGKMDQSGPRDRLTLLVINSKVFLNNSKKGGF